ncbi:alpha/beta-hydrolase [Amniculicola lignicola CBS 123094]|uniref:triacylglycerol lipase n=1 Tax=Amniculicola lignicola CBS 123094 TaxID=1392246 RepID=A0A6A5WFR1_9PLEO|nr:alpha/beta-hydrolase [Amniculicola lignicola CBS 123094]
MPSHGFWKPFTQGLVAVAVVVQLIFIIAALSSFIGVDVFRHIRQQTVSSSSTRGGLDTINKPGRNDLVLRQVLHHGAGHPGPRMRRLDVDVKKLDATALGVLSRPFSIRTKAVTIDRPATRHHYKQRPISPMWISEDIPGPDVEDKETVVNFAWMSEDAYKPNPSDPEWVEVGERFNNSIPFGWEDAGIRGHVFSDDTNSTIVLAVKGTSVDVFVGNGTSAHDKENDNLFGSCCCGQGGAYLWSQPCDCKTGTYTCDETCVKQELVRPNRYFEATLELYDEVMKLYPQAHVMAVGHSLGGVLASLIGLQHGVPAVTFEAYPQALAATRLGLYTAGDQTPLRKATGAFHFGHTADPVYMGTCNGASSFCSIAGYAFETICHTGQRCVYDVVKDWGWRQSTNTHRLRYAISEVYEKYDEAAPCQPEEVDCSDCYLWKFENGTKQTTSSTSTSVPTTRTRSETCKTPGWWGCNDPTTTSGATTTAPITTTIITTTTSTSTSTCKTPGWFGCKDQIETGTATTTTSTTATTTCTSKGWFGRCLDPTTTTTKAEAAQWRTAPVAIQTPP